VVAAQRRLEDHEAQIQQDREHLRLAVAASEESFNTSRKRRHEDAARDHKIAQEDHNTRVARAHSKRMRTQALLEASQSKKKHSNNDGNDERKDEC
jgi:hypothetical protein